MNRLAGSLLNVILILGSSSELFASQAATSMRMSELVRSSDFIGTVHASMIAEYSGRDTSGSIWRQHVMLISADPIRGQLTHLPSIPSSNPFPHIWAGNTQGLENPTRFEGRGEYLVFLRREEVNGGMDWVAKAVLPIHYRPDRTGKIEGRIGDKSSLEATEVVNLIRLAMSDERPQIDSDQKLAQLLEEVAATSAAQMDRAPQSLTFEQRRAQIEAIALNIKQGTLRSEIEKVFPEQDGGLSGPSETRYYVGSEVMVAVPFDQTGGSWNLQNRVNGTPRIYRSFQHVD